MLTAMTNSVAEWKHGFHLLKPSIVSSNPL